MIKLSETPQNVLMKPLTAHPESQQVSKQWCSNCSFNATAYINNMQQLTFSTQKHCFFQILLKISLHLINCHKAIFLIIRLIYTHKQCLCMK